MIIMPYPKPNSKARAIYSAFSLDVWIGILLSYSVIIFCLWFFSWQSDTKTTETVGDWFMYLMSAISKQGIQLMQQPPLIEFEAFELKSLHGLIIGRIF